MTKEQILLVYKKRKSIRQTAFETGLSAMTIKKVLIDEGVFITKTSQMVKNLYEQGLSVNEIIEETGLSRSSVYNYLPYKIGNYNTDSPSDGALYMRKYRAKKTNEKEECGDKKHKRGN